MRATTMGDIAIALAACGVHAAFDTVGVGRQPHGRAGGGKAQVAVRPPLGSEVPLDVGTIVGVDATKKTAG